jgi:Tol biopolymer transport system component
MLIVSRLIISFLTLLCIVIPCTGQAFGRNKIQYKTFEFKQLKTEHYTIYFYPAESTAVQISAEMLENWYSRYTKIFGFKLPKSQPVILYASQADFQQTNAIPDLISQATGGVTEGTMNRMIIPLTGIFSENNHVLGHELTHAFQYTQIQSLSSLFNSFQIPLWFIEGMAEYLSLGSISPLTSIWMRDAVLRKDVPSIGSIGRDMRYFPYRYGHAIWSYIAGRWGDEIVGPLFSAVVSLGLENGLSSTLGMSVDSLSKSWRNSILSSFDPKALYTSDTSYHIKTIQSSKDINLSPSISPDGKQIAFLSSRDLFSIDLYLADARTGKIIKKLVSSESDERFETIRFVNLSGSWSPDGKYFAFVVFEEGNNAVAIADVSHGFTKKIIKISGTNEINHISWSPNGRTLVLSASEGAISNLYLYDLKEKSTRKLTDDLYAEFQPVWSPDGKTIAFVTDRIPLENQDSIFPSKMRIGLMSTDGDSARYLSVANWANHINPQYSPDGTYLYFISDPDGIPQIYRYSFADSTYLRISHVKTGVGGLTSLSPAMSVSSKSGTIVFNVFNNLNYSIQSIESSELFPDTISYNYSEYLLNASLPPKNRSNSFVNKYLSESDTFFYAKRSTRENLYKPKLRLWYIGQIFAGITAGPFGVSAGGQVSLLFSDILGNHVLGVGLQSTGGWNSIGGSLLYLNQKSRFNWGYIFSHFPYVTSRVLDESDSIKINGVKIPVRGTTVIDERVYEDQINVYGSYPLSIHRRFELRGGYHRIGYSKDAAIIQGPDIFSPFDEVTVTPPPAINQFEVNGAYVGDFSYTGFTGPVKGRRFRLEIQPSFGSLFFTDVTGDLRLYKFFKPLTLAFRTFTWGRYFGQSDHFSLPEAFLGYEDWVRGYSMGSFNLNNDVNNGDSSEFKRLLGTRVAVANFELRVPLLGNEQLGLINFPYIPLDIIGFFDSGVAWNASSPIVWRIERNSNLRIPVFSAGSAIRFNLLGVFVFQVYLAYPFQRPGEGWKWGFFAAPGW